MTDAATRGILTGNLWALPSTVAFQTFEELQVGDLFKEYGGTGEVFKKVSDGEAWGDDGTSIHFALAATVIPG